MSQRSTMIDWNFAVATGARLAGPGPVVSRAEADEVVGELREGAHSSTRLVREYTGLVAEAGTADVVVVDRPGWIQANADGFAHVISPLIDKLEERKGAPTGLSKAIGSKVTGLEVGTLLGFLSGKVLGQFDPFFAPAGSNAVGRLLLVAPNIVQAERELSVDPSDFRLWVCLHEETHRVQFTAVPWMRDYIHSEIANIVGTVETDPAKVAEFVSEGVKKLGDVLRGREDASLLELFSSPAQREVIDRITGVMSLLEGHADVVMDGVGPEVIPSVGEIRSRFDVRRKGAGPLDRLIRKLLGLEAKMAQYRHGASFVRGVTDQVGMEGFNKVWVEPANLPSRDEIGDPAAWVRRVHGS
jgi:coenzyme F420 biosynthesis associated uncharacterized protein